MLRSIRPFVIAGLLTAAHGIAPAQTPTSTEGPQLKVRPEQEALPGANSYRLGEEDEIQIQAVDVEELGDKPVRIDGAGGIRLPLIGRVQAAGRTLRELEDEIARQLQPYVKRPQVTVRLTEGKSHPVSILGAIKSPGVYQIQGPKTLIETLALGGSLADDAGYRVRITRDLRFGALPLTGATEDPTGKFSLGEISIEELFGGKKPTLNIMMRPHDVLSIPRADTVYVMGEVNKPGGFTLRERETMSVLQAVSLAQGTTRLAKAKSVRLLRAGAVKGQRESLEVNLAAILAGRAEDIQMRSDDILFVPNSTVKTVSLRAVEAAIQIGTGVLIWRR